MEQNQIEAKIYKRLYILYKGNYQCLCRAVTTILNKTEGHDKDMLIEKMKNGDWSTLGFSIMPKEEQNEINTLEELIKP